MNTKQHWDSKSYQAKTGFVSKLGEDVLRLLDPQPGESILDLACGDGILTRKIQDIGAQVIGVDGSESFVKTCVDAGLDVRVMDGHHLDFNNKFDAVFSNAALHWMLKPELVASGVAKALKPGGRFVGEFGGFGNVAAIATAMRSLAYEMNVSTEHVAPWYFPTNAEYQQVLEGAGFSDVEIESFYRPTPLPTGMESWLRVMRKPFFDQFGTEADAVLDKVLMRLKPSLCDQSGNWIADYVRIRFKATLNK